MADIKHVAAGRRSRPLATQLGSTTSSRMGHAMAVSCQVVLQGSARDAEHLQRMPNQVSAREHGSPVVYAKRRRRLPASIDAC